MICDNPTCIKPNCRNNCDRNCPSCAQPMFNTKTKGWVCQNKFCPTGDNSHKDSLKKIEREFKKKNQSESIAAEADRIINGERREAYGPIEESSLDLAAIWTVILRKKLKTSIEPREVMLMMVGLKLQRESNSEKRDNRTDLIGYILLADKLSTK